MKCSLCGKEGRSVYARPGDKLARFCARCFFKDPPARVEEGEQEA